MSAIYIVLDRHVYNLYIDFYDLLATLVSNHATPHVTRYLTLFFICNRFKLPLICQDIFHHFRNIVLHQNIFRFFHLSDLLFPWHIA
jgi:hypothetical protein